MHTESHQNRLPWKRIRQREQGGKLFLICPECQTEYRIRQHFSGDLYFMTALGNVFDFGSAQFQSGIHMLIETENIREIILVNADSCRISGAALQRQEQSPSSLSRLRNSNLHLLQKETAENQAHFFAAQQLRQMHLLLSAALATHPGIISRSISIYALIFDHQQNLFTPVSLPETSPAN